MFTRMIVMTMIWILAGFPALGRSIGYQSTNGDDVDAELAARCAEEPEPGSAAGVPTIPFEVPADIAVRPLAASSAQRLPEGTEFSLSAGRLTIAPMAETKRRREGGPFLLLVEQGTISVSVQGRSQEYGPDASVLIEPGPLYALYNPTPDPASAFVVGVFPPEGRTLIGAYGSTSIWEPVAAEEGLVARQRVFGAVFAGLAREETVLFVDCLTWTDAAAELPLGGAPGPVGVLVLAGGARLNETASLGTGDCWLVPAFTPVHLEAAAPMSTLLLFGALPADALSRPVTEAAPSSGAGIEVGNPGCTGREVGDDPD